MASLVDLATRIGQEVKTRLKVMPAITAAVDLNDYVTTAVYPIASAAVSGLVNAPDARRTATAKLYVEVLANGVIHQEYVQYEATVWKRWERARVSGNWNTWRDITPGAAAPVETGTPARSSTTSVACIGDSLTDGYSNSTYWDDADSYPGQLGEYLGAGVTVTNRGFSGATTDQINLRVGAQPLQVNVTSPVPSSGPIPLTTQQVIGAWGGDVAFNAYGYLGDSYGLLAYTVEAGYTFTRSSGPAVVAGPQVFTGQFRDHRTDTIVYMAGRNDITKGTVGMEATIVDHMLRGYADVLQYATPTRKQVAFCGTITRTDEAPGSAGFQAVEELSTRLRLQYPDRFIDVQGYLTSAQVWTDTGITPTSADTQAQAQGITPPSLFDDVTHYNRVTARAIGRNLIGPWLRKKGWI